MKIRPTPPRGPDHDHSELYTAYLQSPAWAETRRLALVRAGHRCSVCAATTGLEVHHTTYDHLGAEPWSELVVLCSSCHTDADRRRAVLGSAGRRRAEVIRLGKRLKAARDETR